MFEIGTTDPKVFVNQNGFERYQHNKIQNPEKKKYMLWTGQYKKLEEKNVFNKIENKK